MIFDAFMAGVEPIASPVLSFAWTFGRVFVPAVVVVVVIRWAMLYRSVPWKDDTQP